MLVHPVVLLIIPCEVTTEDFVQPLREQCETLGTLRIVSRSWASLGGDVQPSHNLWCKHILEHVL